MTFHFKCPKCQHEFYTGFWKWFWSPHWFNVRKYMKCPACQKKGWMKDYTFLKLFGIKEE